MQKFRPAIEFDETRFRSARLTAFLLFALTAAGLIWLAVWHDRTETDKAVCNSHITLKSINDLKGAQIEHWLQERVHDLRNIAIAKQRLASQTPPMEPASVTISRGGLMVTEADWKQVSGGVALMCFDPQGNLLSAYPGINPEDIDPCTQEGVLNAVQFRHATASGFFVGRDRACYVDVAHPGYLGKDQPVVWVARFDTRYFFRSLLGYYLKTSKSGESYLVRPCRKGVQLMSPLRFRPHSTPEFYLPLDDPKLSVSMAGRGARGMVEGADYRGEPVISAIRDIKGSPWILITEVNRAEVIAGLREQSLLSAGVAVCLIGFAGIGLSRLHRQRQHALQAELTVAMQDKHLLDAIHRDILHTAMDGFCVLDQTGSIREANEAYCQMCGYSLEELRQMRISDLENRETSDETAEHIRKIVAAGADRFESMQKHKDGSTFTVEVSVQYRPEFGWFVVFLRDITARKQMETELQQALAQATLASRSKGEFLAVMSHELRTPLNSVLGFSELLADTCLDSQQQEYLTNIHDSGVHLLHHVSDILDFTSMGNSGVPCETKPFQLSEICGPTPFQPFQSASSAKNLDLQCHLSPTLPDWVIGDASRLQRILEHLIDNAVKFSDSGCIRVEVRPAADCGQDWVEFVVTDQGPGISIDQQQRIFEPFTQGQTGLDRPHEGVGMGLAISRKLATTLGGSIFLESTPGKGCMFRVVLPLPACSHCGEVSDLTSPPQANAADAEITPRSVLVAEDDPINQKLAAKFLKLLGYDCVLAKNGQEAVERFVSGSFAAVLMDIQMPVMDGIQATRAIRKSEQGHTPIIALTANVLPEDRERCREAGMNGFVAKPFKKEDLRKALDALLAG